MISIQEKYIPFDTGRIYVKQKTNRKNKSVAVFLPGSTLSPRNFWDCDLPEGGTLADRMVEGGVDVAMVDPIGYGSSQGEGPSYYHRVYFADQLDRVYGDLRANYSSITTVGFCATTMPPLLSLTRGTADNAILLSPNLVFGNPKQFNEIQSLYKAGHGPRKHLTALLKRFVTISDKRLGRSDKFFNWYHGQVRMISSYTSFDNLTETYQSPGSFIIDGVLFPAVMKKDGLEWERLKNKKILIIDPEFEVEVSRERFAATLTHLSSYADVDMKVLPGSTHFPMWESNRHTLLAYIIKFIDERNSDV